MNQWICWGLWLSDLLGNLWWDLRDTLLRHSVTAAVLSAKPTKTFVRGSVARLMHGTQELQGAGQMIALMPSAANAGCYFLI